METKEKKLKLSFLNEKKEVIDNFEKVIPSYLYDMMKDKDVSFYYTFKDSVLELESRIKSKFFVKNEVFEGFSVLFEYDNNPLLSFELDISKSDIEIIFKKQVDLYYLVDTCFKQIMTNIIDQHKNYIFSSK
jgi:hypothetical protein